MGKSALGKLVGHVVMCIIYVEISVVNSNRVLHFIVWPRVFAPNTCFNYAAIMVQIAKYAILIYFEYEHLFWKFQAK